MQVAVIESFGKRRILLRAITERSPAWPAPIATSMLYEVEQGGGHAAARALALAQHRGRMADDRTGLFLRLVVEPRANDRSVWAPYRRARIHLTDWRDSGLKEERVTACQAPFNASWKAVPPEHEARFGWQGNPARRCKICAGTRLQQRMLPPRAH